MRKFCLFLIVFLIVGNVCSAQTGWSPQVSTVSSWLQNVSFTDVNNGTAVGVFGQILRTTNGGATWTFQPGAAGGYLTGVSFTDTNTGTIVGGNGLILRTTNGGATWTTQTSGTTNFLWQVKFTSADTGTVVGNSGLILRTTNGGATWTPQTSGTSADLYNVHFTNANHGTVVGVNGTILRTTNGGATWTAQASGITNQNLLSVNFTDASTGTIVGVNGIILRTTNGGATWTPQTSGTANKLMGVSFSDANTGTVVGELGTILRTTNGGTTWIPQSGGTNKDLVGVTFVNANFGTIVGETGVILRTSNGGGACTSAPPQPGIITGMVNPCSGIVKTYTVAAVPGANTYTWTLPSGWSGTSTASSITVTTGTAAGTLTVAAVNTCGTGVAQSLAVSPVSSPVATNTAMSSPVFCQGGSVVLSANTGSGLTYQWQLNGSNISGATNPTYTAATAGAYAVIVSNSSGCSGISNITGVTVNPLPNPLITHTSSGLTAPSGFSSYQWYQNNVLIPGATAPNYTPTQPGNYYASVTNGNNCSGQSNIINVVNLGVDDPFDSNAFVFYPNPTNGMVTLKGNAFKPGEKICIQVINALGKVLLTENTEGNPNGFEKELDLSIIPNGIYFIKINARNLNEVKQVMKH